MKKIISLLVVIVMSATLMTSCSKKAKEVGDSKGKPIDINVEYDNKKLGDGIVAMVGDEAITEDEAEFYLALLSSSVFQQSGLENASKEEKDKQLDSDFDDEYTFREMIYKQCIESLVNVTLLAELGKAKGIDYTDEKLKEAYEKNGMLEQKEEMKKLYNVTDSGIDAYTKKQFIYSDYAQQYLQEDERMNPDEAALKEYFNENFYKAKHILKMTVNQETNEPLSEDEKAKVKKNAEKILSEVKGGSDFDKAVENESEDPGSKSQPEGYVFTEGEMVTEFYEGTKALKVDEISDIVETSYGYHIIKRLPLNDSDYANNTDKVKSAYQNVAFEKLIEDEKAKNKIYVDYEKLLNINGVFYVSLSDTQSESETVADKKQEE